MKKNEIYEGIVTELKFPNKGKILVKKEEETVMVKIAGTKSPVSSCQKQEK